MNNQTLRTPALVSVVVPIYNVSAYLMRCVNSIQNQTYSNLEIVLVNDGSTDDSGAQCDFLAETDSRIKVIHQNNKGVSAARNTAIEIITGDYVVFVDSDDYLGPNHIENLFSPFGAGSIQKNTVVITGATEVLQNEILTDCCLEKSPKVFPLEKDDALCELVQTDGRFASYAWGKLYSKELFDVLSFPIGRLYEDQAIAYKVLLKADYIYYEDARDYYYVVDRQQSISNASRLNRLDFLEAIRTMKNDPDLQNDPVKKVVFERYIASLAESCMISAKYCSRQRFGGYFSELVNQRKQVSNKHDLPVKVRGVLIISHLGERLFRFVAKMIYR